MTPYRRALIEHMQLRGLSQNTVDAYVAWMRDLCAFLRKTPDWVTAEDFRRFVVHLVAEKGAAYGSVNQAKCGIRYYFTHVLERPWIVGDLPPMKKGSALPEVQSMQEVVRLLEAPVGLRGKTLLRTAYAGGLRVSELVALRPLDIQRDREMVFIKGGKGNKDRYLPLSARNLRDLERYFRACLSWNRNGDQSPWLFPSHRDSQRHIDPCVAQRAFNEAKKLAGVRRGKGIHTLRHSYAVHSLEMGVDIKTLQVRLGHATLHSTLPYLRVASISHRSVASPYDHLEEWLSSSDSGDAKETDDREEGIARQE